MKLPRLSILASVLLALPGPFVHAQDAFYEVPLAQLKLEEGTLPSQVPSYNAMRWRGDVRSLWPRVLLTGEGEAYIGPPEDLGAWLGREDGAVLVVRAPAGADVHGELQFPDLTWTRMERSRFVIPASAADDSAEGAFQRGRHLHFLRLANEDLPGAAWFRHREIEARGDETGADRRWLRRSRWEDDLEGTYTLFSGGRALAENLQLDRALPDTEEAPATVALDSIDGVTVREWEPTLEGEGAPADPLAALVPDDQHALFFRSFDDLVRLADEGKRFGAPVLAAMETRSQSAHTLARYEEQLGLGLDSVARMLGSVVVASVAITGSDPYLRTGSDVAVLFEAKQLEVVRSFVQGRQRMALSKNPGAEKVSGELAGTAYTGVVSPSRALSSYSFEVGGRVVVTNSLAQIERIVSAVGAGATLDRAPEYRFFRRRYRLDDAGDTGFVMVPDAAIRRWCGPRWRIATARRTLALAAMAELQAEHLAELEAGVAEPRALEVEGGGARFGPWSLTEGGILSRTYGSLDFLKPVAEMEFDTVTEEEARLYGLWRDGYERAWSNFFDPIAIRFVVEDGRVEVDVSVIPLIGGSEYRDLAELCGTSTLEVGQGDPHAEALVQFAMSIDVDAEPMREVQEMMSGAFSQVGASPLGWFRGDFAIYADESPFWDVLAEAGDLEEMEELIEVDLNELPITLHFGVTSPLKLAGFLATVRALADSTVPGLLAWRTEETPAGHPYLRVGGERLIGDDYSLFYAATPEALLVGLNADAMERATDRAFARLGEPAESADDGAISTSTGVETLPEDDFPAGHSVTVEVEKRGLTYLEALGDESMLDWMRGQSWANLPILNEWRRLYPERDPVRLHAELWGEELTCPGGGRYVWNEEWRTLESTVYGHPGDPREGPKLPKALVGAERMRAGLTFEDEGVRARVELRR